jgi:hypothetical protein
VKSLANGGPDGSVSEKFNSSLGSDELRQSVSSADVSGPKQSMFSCDKCMDGTMVDTFTGEENEELKVSENKRVCVSQNCINKSWYDVTRTGKDQTCISLFDVCFCLIRVYTDRENRELCLNFELEELFVGYS